MKRFLKILLWTNAVSMFGLNILINCNVINASVLNTLKSNMSLADDCSYNPPTCVAGGCRSTSCSYTGSIGGRPISTQIACEGAWACCDITAFCFSKSLCGNGNDNC